MKTVSISSATTFKALVSLAGARGTDGGAQLTAAEVRSALDSFRWGDDRVTRAEVLAARTELLPLQRQGRLTPGASKVLDDWFHTVGEGQPGGFTFERAASTLDTLTSYFRFNAASEAGATFTAQEATALVSILGPNPAAARIGDVEALRQLLAAQKTSEQAQQVLSGWLRAHPIPTPALGPTLKPILSGLSMFSETDRPVFAVELGPAPGPRADLATALRSAAQEGPEVKVEERDFETEFARLSTPSDPNDPLLVETAKRFAQLGTALSANLTELRIFRVGEVDLDVYVLGKDRTGHWAGVMSGVVET